MESKELRCIEFGGLIEACCNTVGGTWHNGGKGGKGLDKIRGQSPIMIWREAVYRGGEVVKKISH